jgi:hypothetical protein
VRLSGWMYWAWVFAYLDFFLIGIVGVVESNWVHSALRPLKGLLPARGDYDDGEIGGMIGRGNQSTRRKRAPVSLCPPQTPHAARTWTRAATVGSQWQTAWTTAQPYLDLITCWFPIISWLLFVVSYMNYCAFLSLYCGCFPLSFSG